MIQRVMLVAVSIVLLFCLGQTSQPGEKKPDPAQAEAEKLEGTWVEINVPAAKKAKLLGAYCNWTFKGKTVVRRFVQTLDGIAMFFSYQKGTYKVDTTGKVMAIDMLLTRDDEKEERKHLGIYKFEGDNLILCVSADNRPTTFEAKGDPRYVYSKGEIRLNVLRRVPTE